MDSKQIENEIRRIPKIKKFLFVEDGSVDIGDLGKRLAGNPEIAVVVYRQGSLPPQLVDVKNGGNKQ
nr:MAG TPA: hypothetical protein [Caudoviricetes sp.]